MIKQSNKYREFFIFFKLILMLTCLADIANTTYGFIWSFISSGLEPMYGNWFQYTFLDFVIIIFLFMDKTQLIALLLYIGYTLYGLFSLISTSGANPLPWLHLGNIAIALNSLNSWISLIFGLLSLFLFFQLQRTKSKA